MGYQDLNLPAGDSLYIGELTPGRGRELQTQVRLNMFTPVGHCRFLAFFGLVWLGMALGFFVFVASEVCSFWLIRFYDPQSV